MSAIMQAREQKERPQNIQKKIEKFEEDIGHLDSALNEAFSHDHHAALLVYQPLYRVFREQIFDKIDGSEKIVAPILDQIKQLACAVGISKGEEFHEMDNAVAAYFGKDKTKNCIFSNTKLEENLRKTMEDAKTKTKTEIDEAIRKRQITGKDFYEGLSNNKKTLFPAIIALLNKIAEVQFLLKKIEKFPEEVEKKMAEQLDEYAKEIQEIEKRMQSKMDVLNPSEDKLRGKLEEELSNHFKSKINEKIDEVGNFHTEISKFKSECADLKNKIESDSNLQNNLIDENKKILQEKQGNLKEKKQQLVTFLEEAKNKNLRVDKSDQETIVKKVSKEIDKEILDEGGSLRVENIFPYVKQSGRGWVCSRENEFGKIHNEFFLLQSSLTEFEKHLTRYSNCFGQGGVEVKLAFIEECKKQYSGFDRFNLEWSTDPERQVNALFDDNDSDFLKKDGKEKLEALQEKYKNSCQQKLNELSEKVEANEMIIEQTKSVNRTDWLARLVPSAIDSANQKIAEKQITNITQWIDKLNEVELDDVLFQKRVDQVEEVVVPVGEAVVLDAALPTLITDAQLKKYLPQNSGTIDEFSQLIVSIKKLEHSINEGGNENNNSFDLFKSFKKEVSEQLEYPYPETLADGTQQILQKNLNLYINLARLKKEALEYIQKKNGENSQKVGGGDQPTEDPNKPTLTKKINVCVGIVDKIRSVENEGIKSNFVEDLKSDTDCLTKCRDLELNKVKIFLLTVLTLLTGVVPGLIGLGIFKICRHYKKPDSQKVNDALEEVTKQSSLGG